MPLAYRIPTMQEPLHCAPCQRIATSNDEVDWYAWASPVRGKEVFCSNCLGDPDQHWGEELCLFRQVSFGRGSPESIHVLLDRVEKRSEIAPFGEHQPDAVSAQPRSTSPTTIPEYRYQSPITTSRQIRILCLHPGAVDAPVECTLEVIDFHERYRDYTAISYTWGDPAANKFDIHIRDAGREWTSFKVLENLHQLLLHVRHRNEERRLWVDAICVNQGNDEVALSERKVQLDLMGEIYRQASRVTVWLGLANPEEHSDLVFEIIQKRDAKRMREHDFRKGMAQIVHRPWFQRTWIVQELALNDKAPWLLCGYQQVPWPRFNAAFSFITTYKEKAQTVQDFDTLATAYHDETLAASTIHSLATTRMHVQADGGAIIERPIYRTLLRSGNSKVSDARDKVYGIRGVMSKRLLGLFPADYRNSVPKAYQDAVQYMLKHEEAAGLFAQFPLPPAEERPDSWPSWLPDFNSTKPGLQTVSADADFYYRYAFRPMNFKPPINLPRHHPQGPKPQVVADFRGSRLIAKGVPVDFISEFTPSTIDPSYDYLALSKAQNDTSILSALMKKFDPITDVFEKVGGPLDRAQNRLASTEFKNAKWKYLATLSTEEMIRVGVEEVVGGARIQLLTGLSMTDYFESAKEAIRARVQNSEERDAFLSILTREIDEKTAWNTPIEPLSLNATEMLSREVATLLEAPVVPSRQVIDLRMKFIELAGQYLLLQKDLKHFRAEKDRLIPQLQEAVVAAHRHLKTLVDTLTEVDTIWKSADSSSNNEWNTDIWHSLLDGYRKLQDISPQSFRDAFFDMIYNKGSVTEYSESIPLPDHGLSDEVTRALTDVFHAGMNFFICQKTKMYGITTPAVKKGDMLVFLFPTWFMPVILRKVEGSGDYHMVGAAVLPSARRLELLAKYTKYKLLQDDKLVSFSII